MTDAGSHSVTYTGYYDAERRPLRGVVPIEEAIVLCVNDRSLVRLMCTPVRLEELALGFLFNQGLIEGPDEVEAIELPDENEGCRLNVRLHHELEAPQLRVFTSGYSGGATFEDVRGERYELESDLCLAPQQVTGLMEELAQATTLYRRVGGVHGAALADGQRLLCSAEDIGRNNALDKIAGICMREGFHTRDRVLLVTGRISSEMLHKVARMAVPIAISRKSPTSLSVRLARAWGITLVGYARRRSFRIYAGEERIVTTECFSEEDSRSLLT